MRSHIRFFIPLVIVLAFCIISSSPQSALTQSHTAQRSAGMLRPFIADARAKDPLCGGKVAQHGDVTAMFGAPGGALDAGDFAQLLVPNIGRTKVFAPPSDQRVETIEAMPDAGEPLIVGLPEDNRLTKILSVLRPAGQTFTVHVGGGDGVSFEPSALNIQAGDTVKWVWDGPNHTVTSGTSCISNGDFNSTGPTFSHTFNTIGSFKYFCSTHCYNFGMAGQITVQGSASTFSISGEVTTGSSTAVGGVTMSLSGAQTATTTTNASGEYSFANLASGNYTVTPSHVNYTFTPASLSYTNLSANQTNQDFTATLKLYSISGQVKVGTSGLPGVTMTLTSPTPAGFTPRTVTTNSTGNYTFIDVPAGRNYTLKPSKTGYTFNPASRSYTSLSADQANQDFAATANSFSISGLTKVGTSGLAGVTMKLVSTTTGFTPRTVTTSSTGSYSFTNVPGGRSYTLTPTKTNYSFTPVSKSYTNLSANQTSQNFAATLKTYTISGRVKLGSTTTGLAAVTMTLTSPTPAGFTPRTVQTNSTGNYTFTNVPAGRNYTLTPTKTNYNFTPVSKSYTNLSADQTLQNFAATLKTYIISGRVKLGSTTTGLAAVTMTLTSPTPAGFTPRTVTTNSTGNYSFTGVPAGRNYTLKPSKSGYTFTPVSKSYTNLSADQTLQNFAATLKTYTISGRVKLGSTTTGLAAVTMTLTSPTPAGFNPRTTQTNSTGNYSFTNVPAARNYTLKPSKSGYTFNPVSRSYTNLSADQTGTATSFSGTPTSSVSGDMQFSETSYVAGEGDGKFEVTVIRSGDVSAPASIDYSVDDGTASDRSDYSTSLGTLRFAAGETSRSFTIFLTDDAYTEGDETVKLTLGNATGGAEMGSRNTAALTITDNDNAASSTNPVDDPAFFVRQHYVDFLAREPRPEELFNLVNILNRCAVGDIACDRAQVSAGFLRSEEFQRRGYFVYRLYKASLGRPPSYREFIRDMRQIEGANGDELAASQEAFLDEWMDRPEFKDKYDALSDNDYVERLLRTAGMSLAANDGMLGKLERASHTRSQVLREMIESPELARKLDGSASVTMLYFGYLRRNPDAEDVNTVLEFMNDDPQAYRKVVQALINSIKYRSRFGQP